MKNSGKVKIFLARNGIYVALVLLIAFFTFINPNFFSFGNAQNVLLQAVELGLVALPLALLVMSGSVDLSVGAVASAGAVTAGLVMSATGNTLVGIGAGLAFGLLAGAINGFLVSYLGLNPIVVTLGFLSVWGGFALLITGGKTITRAALPEDFRAIGTATVGPVPIQIVILILAVAVAWYLLNRNRVGKQILAIGGNKRSAFLMGLKVRRVQFGLFVVSGFFASFAGILLSAKVQSASPTIGSGMELEALTVVLLGGVAFEGGVGRISGVVAGLLFFRVLRNGLVFLQASPFLQTIIVGLTLVIAVALDSSIQKIVKRSWAQVGKKAIAEEEPNKVLA
jgi:ribose/xylose/arabinose/galactoside ABC-type transport system permease subunit